MKKDKKKAYLGIDIGSISTKGVIIDRDGKILASEYLYTEGNPIEAVKRLVSILKKKFPHNLYKVVSFKQYSIQRGVNIAKPSPCVISYTADS